MAFLALNAVAVTARLTGMAAPVSTTYQPWIGESDCRLDDFRAQVLRDTDLGGLSARRRRAKQRPGVLGRYDPRAERRALQSRADSGARRRARRRGLRGRVLHRRSSTGPARRSSTSSPRSTPRARRPVTTSASRAPTTASGTPLRSWRCTRPQVFAEYYANDALAIVCQAWLGPRYQVTSQVNVVNPGGTQQVPHRDYHLGFVARATTWRSTRHTCTAPRRC